MKLIKTILIIAILTIGIAHITKILVGSPADAQVVITKSAIPPGTTRADGSAHVDGDALTWSLYHGRSRWNGCVY